MFFDIFSSGVKKKFQKTLILASEINSTLSHENETKIVKITQSGRAASLIFIDPRWFLIECVFFQTRFKLPCCRLRLVYGALEKVYKYIIKKTMRNLLTAACANWFWSKIIFFLYCIPKYYIVSKIGSKMLLFLFWLEFFSLCQKSYLYIFSSCIKGTKAKWVWKGVPMPMHCLITRLSNWLDTTQQTTPYNMTRHNMTQHGTTP